MSGYIQDRERQHKINRFAQYILSLDEKHQKEILQHLPEDFETMEQSELSHCLYKIKESLKEIKKKCDKSFCCFNKK